MRYLQYVTWIVGLGLEALVITALLRGAYRRFPIIFTYCCIQFCTIVIEVAAYTAKASSFLGHLRMSRARYYWGIDAILQVLVFAVVISLIYQASAKTRHRELMRRWILAGAVLIFIVSSAIRYHSSAPTSQWAEAISGDLTLSSTVLDLVLWSILIASRRRDQTLLMLSGGLGVQFTGETIGHQIRRFSHSRVLIDSGSLLIVCAWFLCLFVWWQAFQALNRTSRRTQASDGQ